MTEDLEWIRRGGKKTLCGSSEVDDPKTCG